MTDTPASSHAFPIEGDLTIARVRELHDALRTAFAQGIAALDLSGVTNIDGAGLQLLLHARHEAMRAQRDLRIVVASRAVQAAFVMAGMDDALEQAA